MYKLLQFKKPQLIHSPTYFQLRTDSMMPLLMARATHIAKSTHFLDKFPPK